MEKFKFYMLTIVVILIALFLVYAFGFLFYVIAFAGGAIFGIFGGYILAGRKT